MKRVLLVLMVLIPLAVTAQEKNPGPMKDQPGAPASALGPSDDDPQEPNAKPRASTEPPVKPKLKIPGSMVGYIDNPIPESQIRIRFDGAFNDNFPDRAEFFYGKCGCYRAAGLDLKSPGPPPGSTVSDIPNNLNFQQLFVNVEFAPIRRFSIFTEVPIRWIEAEGPATPVGTGPGAGHFPNQGGLSDVTAGFKLAAFASESTYLTFQFTGYFSSGDALKGLGTNHYSVEPAVLLYHRISDRLRLEGEVGDWHPIGGSAGVPTTSSQGFAGDVFFYGIGPSYRLYSGRRVAFTPVLEVVGWHVLSGLQTQLGGPIDGVTADASGKDIVNVKIGARTSIGFHNSIYIGYGHAVTNADWYKQIVRIEYRYSF